MIDWDLINEEYSKSFDKKDAGREAYLADVAFGSLYIQRMLGFTDRELVDHIAENPYMQYLIGYKEYRNERPLDPSLLVTFRKRLPEASINAITEKMFIGVCEITDGHDCGSNSKQDSYCDSGSDAGNEGGTDKSKNDGSDKKRMRSHRTKGR